MAYTFTWEEPLDPDEAKTYTIDWEEYLGEGETISTVQWASVPSGAITIANETNTTTAASARLSVGTGQDGREYEVENTVTTSGGDTLQITGLLKVRSR